MQHNVLTALSPIDGRYQDKTAPLAMFGSEYALIKHRVLVIHWLIHLARDAKLPALSALPMTFAMRSGSRKPIHCRGCAVDKRDRAGNKP